MEWLGFFSDPSVRDISAVGLLVIVVVMVLTGRLIPWWTHRRELQAERIRGDEHKAASEKKDEAIRALLLQNSTLVAGIRIADKFYGDFLPVPGENTDPGRSHVGS